MGWGGIKEGAPHRYLQIWEQAEDPTKAAKEIVADARPGGISDEEIGKAKDVWLKAQRGDKSEKDAAQWMLEAMYKPRAQSVNKVFESPKKGSGEVSSQKSSAKGLNLGADLGPLAKLEMLKPAAMRNFVSWLATHNPQSFEAIVRSLKVDDKGEPDPTRASVRAELQKDENLWSAIEKNHTHQQRAVNETQDFEKFPQRGWK